MSADMKERIRNCSSNEELRKAIEWNEVLRSALKNSLSVLVDLLNSAFSEVSLKDKRFQMFSPCTEEELTNYHLPNDRFDENISELKKKEHLKNFPKFKEFLPPGVLITPTSLNAQLMIALFIFLLADNRYHQGENPEKMYPF